jgi:hypothetical protein
MKVERTTVYDRHPDSPRVMWVTKDGMKFTQEQWQLVELMKRLEKKIVRMLAAGQGGLKP